MFNFYGSSKVTPEESPVTVYNYGSSSGLQLLLHVSKVMKIDLQNNEIGARVVVHDPEDLPFVAEYGINIRPKDMSAIEVNLATISRLGPPWGDCVPEGTQIFFERIPFPYSILGCEKECRHRHLTSQCQCTRREYLRGSVLFKSTTDFPFCNISNITQNDCMNSVVEDIEKGIIICKCKPPCQQTMFKYTVSSSELNERFYRTVKAIRTLDFDKKNGFQITNATNENMMVGVKVYYNTFQVDHDIEIASYSWETLVANVGGNLGFFMGLTLVTFIEILEFLWDIISTTIRRRSGIAQKEYNFPDKLDNYCNSNLNSISLPSSNHWASLNTQQK